MARTAATPTPVPMAWQRGWIAWTGWWISRARGAVRTRGERRQRARARARMRRRQRTCRSGRGVHRRGRVANGVSRGLTLFVTWRVPTENRDEAGVLFPTTTVEAKASKNMLTHNAQLVRRTFAARSARRRNARLNGVRFTMFSRASPPRATSRDDAQTQRASFVAIAAL